MTKPSKRTAVVTGAAGGIGQAVARQFVQNGYHVVLADLDARVLAAVTADLNQGESRAWDKPGDLRAKNYCEELIAYSIETTGRLDVLGGAADVAHRQRPEPPVVEGFQQGSSESLA